MEERTLVLIKPDAMIKKLAGNIINDLYNLDLKMIGLKLVDVKRELAEQHYNNLKEEKGEKIFEATISHITGELHGNEKVIAIAYEGENAIQKIRDFIGETNPEKAKPNSIRGKYGRIVLEKDLFETVIHASDSKENAEREIALWFEDKELIE
ncbi:MAG: nucleoside-diphosphate kinase [Candidatus Pacearchaeota archaeon]